MKLTAAVEISDPNHRALRVTPFWIVYALSLILLLEKSALDLIHAQFWAEDGAVFFQQQFPFWQPRLFVPSAGYLHFIPRLVAWAAKPSGVLHAPLFYCLAASMIEALAISYAVRRLAGVVSEMVVLLAFTAMPHIFELFGNLANAQWFTQFIVVCACFMPGDLIGDKGKFAKRAEYCLLLLAALTGPFSIFATVVLLLVVGTARLPDLSWATFLQSAMRRVAERLPRDRSIIVVSCALIQFVFVLTFFDSQKYIGRSLSAGDRLHVAESALLLIVAPLGLLFLVRKRLTPWLYGVSLAFYAFALIQPLAAAIRWHNAYGFIFNQRYAFAILTLCPIILGVILQALRPRWELSYKLALLTVFLVFAIGKPRLERVDGLDDFRWSSYVDRINAGEVVKAPINPSPWYLWVGPGAPTEALAPGQTGDN